MCTEWNCLYIFVNFLWLIVSFVASIKIAMNEIYENKIPSFQKNIIFI